MAQETLNVKGMSCEHCIKAVKSSVGDLSGVSAVDVDLKKGTVFVDYDETKTEHGDIVEAIDDQGYDVVS
ncbi:MULTISPECIES: copper chaperone CopZ [Sinobaca]|uniref:Copper chaperone CopZ n=1 Tax=Sinobaca qinghaiensis TaxID=342944 RepID=A0A419V7F6_9BACL|nr:MULTISPECIES: copper chaperone CopZ [Sinobaca]RKD76024.1 copper chaperone [Sinobaca qinghaiensis]